MSSNQAIPEYCVREAIAAPPLNAPVMAAWDGRMARIVIADEHPISRAGLRALLQTAGGFHVVGEASHGEMTLKLTRELRPDVLLIDCSLSLQDGMNMLRQLQAEGISVRTLLLSSFVEHRDVLKALQLGAAGILMKDSTAPMLFKGIRTVVEGQYWIGREGGTGLVNALKESVPKRPDGQAAREFGLTPREIEILQTVVRGFSNLDIATKFRLSLNTVKHHITHVFDKLGVSNRLELALFAINHHLVDETMEGRYSDLEAKKPAIAHALAHPSELPSRRA